MALQMNIELASGPQVENAYARVAGFTGSKEKLMFVLSYYYNQESAESRKPSLKDETHDFAPSVADDSPNFIKQAYLYLKTLPEFETAVDV